MCRRLWMSILSPSPLWGWSDVDYASLSVLSTGIYPAVGRQRRVRRADRGVRTACLADAVTEHTWHRTVNHHRPSAGEQGWHTRAGSAFRDRHDRTLSWSAVHLRLGRSLQSLG